LLDDVELTVWLLDDLASVKRNELLLAVGARDGCQELTRRDVCLAEMVEWGCALLTQGKAFEA